MNFFDFISEKGTVLHNGVEVPAQVTSGSVDRYEPVIERLEIATFNNRGEYLGSIMIFDDGTAAAEIERHGIRRPV